MRPATARRASDSDRFSSQATGMGCRGASAPGIVAPGAMGKCMGLFLRFRCEPSPLALDVADDGLTALVDVDVRSTVTFCWPLPRWQLSASSEAA